MKKYIFIAIGGTFGAILRFLLERVQIYHYHNSFPMNTLLINVTGTFALALVLTIAFEIRKFDANLRIGISSGFLGAFTTFSTLCKETIGLIKDGLYLTAITYILISAIFGLVLAYLGVVFARKVILKFVRKYVGVE